MLLKKRSVIAITAAFLAVPAISFSQTTSSTASTSSSASVPADKLSDKYSSLAGSGSNSKSMVTGLRDGTDFKLTSTDSKGGTTTTTINPPTGKLGYGNVNIALALAEASLKQLGINNPTPEQLKAALNGGTITTSSGTTTLAGVLQMRADGKGWGQIAHSLGFKLGDVVRSDKANGAIADHRPDGKGEMAKTAGIERADRPAKVERPDRPERPVKVERPDKPERPGR